jgi:hypothetical protein
MESLASRGGDEEELEAALGRGSSSSIAVFGSLWFDIIKLELKKLTRSLVPLSIGETGSETVVSTARARERPRPS